MRRFLALAVAGGVLGLPAYGQEPVSAIGWLSESLRNPPPFEITPESPPLVPETVLGIIEKKGLDGLSPDAIGLLAPSVTGFPVDMWGDIGVAEAVRLIRDFPESDVPAVHEIFHRILLAQANPPRGSNHTGPLLQARIDRLFEMGALDAAEALVNLDTPASPEMFERAFDIAILTDRTLKVCETLANAPALTDDLSKRVYCLARSGDWNAAAITLSLGASIGAISRERELLLIRFLDPQMFEGAPDPEVPDPLEPMDFVLREAVFLPRPSGPLPLPYLYRDTESRAPLRARIEASERLVKSGALPPPILFEAYRTGNPAASGGVWGRQRAIQEMDRALESGTPDAIATALQEAVQLMREAGLLTEFAAEFGDSLAKLPYDPALAPAAGYLLDVVHLAGLDAPEWKDYAEPDPRHDLARRLVQRRPLDSAPQGDAMVQAITAAMAGNAPDSPMTKRLRDMLAKGNTAQALLGAMRLLSDGAAADPGSIGSGLYILREAGQDAAARRIAVQILLLPEAL